MDTEETLSLRQASSILGITTSKLRRFCNRGLIQHVRRTKSGYRILSMAQVDWVKTLVYFDRCGMSTAEIKKYRDLCRKGRITLTERKAILLTKKRQLWQELEDLRENIDFIERKEELFDTLEPNEDTPFGDWV